MEPRPPRPGAAALAGGAPLPRPAIAPPRPVVPVGSPSPRRTPTVEAEPLPADTRRALSGIARQLRDVPRAIIGDPAEVVHFLGRTARALERLRDAPVPVAAPIPPAQRSPQLAAPMTQASPRALTPRERAEAAFRAPAGPDEVIVAQTPSALPAPRIVTDRRGRGVRVEVRRASALGDLFTGPYG